VTPEYVLDNLWSMVVPALVCCPPALLNPTGADIAADSALFGRCTIPARATIGFHSTDTEDCITVRSGSVTLILETSEVVMSTGNCVVQRNTVHGWRNSGSEPCVLIGVVARQRRLRLSSGGPGYSSPGQRQIVGDVGHGEIGATQQRGLDVKGPVVVKELIPPVAGDQFREHHSAEGVRILLAIDRQIAEHWLNHRPVW